MTKIININGEAISVSDEVYYTYYKMRRYEKTLIEKDMRNRLLYYDSWLEGCLLPKIPLLAPEDIVIKKQMMKNLYRCLSMLSEAEHDLIIALFFKEKTIAALSQEMNVPARTLGCRRDRVLQKLKKLMLEQ